MRKDKRTELAYTRKKVNKINHQLFNLLERRFVLTNQIGQIKKDLDLPIEDTAIENKLKSEIPYGIYNIYVNEIFEKILEQSKLQQSRGKFPSVILTGMPLSGKTTFGKAIAEELNIPFVDLDEAISSVERTEIKDIILNKGENYFRKKERAMVKKLSGGYIIALGGGTVLNPKNIEYLKTIGKIVFIKRDLKELSKFAYKDRPLITNKRDLTKIYKERSSVYESVADYTVLNNKNFNYVKNKLIKTAIKIMRDKK